MTRRRLLLALLVVGAALAALPTAAQVRMGSGHALDSNLQLGTWGYNRTGRAAFGQENTARLYTPTYSVSRPQDIRRDNHDSFLNERHYGMDRPVGQYDRRSRPRSGSVPAGFSWGAQRVEPMAAPPPPQPAAASLSPEAVRQMEEISYGIGFYLGQEIREGLALDGVEVDVRDVVAGFGEGLRELDPSVPLEEIEAALAAVHRQLETRMLDRLLAEDPQFRKRYEENLARSRSFHEEFGREGDVVTLPEGIQYKVLVPGEGVSPGPTDVVVLNIRISLVDGTEISREQGVEARIDLMVEAGARVLPRMKVGARWLTAIPPDQAYGAAGQPPEIGPNETLLIEVELIEVKD